MLKRPEQIVEPNERGVIPPLSSTVVSSTLVFLDSLAILVTGYISYDLIVVYSINGNVYISAVLFIWIATLSLMNFGGLYHFDIALRPQARLSFHISHAPSRPSLTSRHSLAYHPARQ